MKLKNMKTTFILWLLATACIANDANYTAVYPDLEILIADSEISVTEKSQKLEDLYVRIGHPVKIDHPRENSCYQAPLYWACNPEMTAHLFNELMASTGNKRQAKGRSDIFQYWFDTHNCSEVDFTAQHWASLNPNSRMRYRLFKSYRKRNKIRGMQFEQIVKDLGPSNPRKHLYCLGPDLTMIGIDSLWVGFTVTNGIVADFQYFSD